jgi:hypothetical protein
MRVARGTGRLDGFCNSMVFFNMPASLKPDSLLVDFLFTAPCLFAKLSITCEARSETRPVVRPVDNDPQQASLFDPHPAPKADPV